MPESPRCTRCGEPAEWIAEWTDEERDSSAYCDPCMNWVESMLDRRTEDEEAEE